MAPLRMAVIGVGHLGKEHARILAGLPEVQLVGVCDVNAEQAQAVARRNGVRAFSSYWPLLNLVDAATIVVPTTYHHAVACEFLNRGIPLLVEKPLAASLDQARELVALAKQQGTLLQVGHIERFNPAFEELQRRPLQPKFIECERLGPYTGRSTDIGVVLDLMIHDIDLLLALTGAPVRSVEAIGAAVMGSHEDMVNARLGFANGSVANVTASRVSPQPRRRMRVWAPEGYAGLDFVKRRIRFVQPSERMRRTRTVGLQDSGNRGMPADGFTSYIEALDLDCNRGDQLTRELQHFVQCVQTNTRPRVTGEDGLRAMEVATQVIESLRLHQWDGQATGPVGPTHLPLPLGRLFQAAGDEAAA